MNNASCKELLTGNKWLLDKSEDLRGFTDDILRRHMPVKQEDIDKLVEFLKKWTDAKNYTDDSTAACATVLTPMVHHGKTRSGTWYGGRITSDWVVDADGLKTLHIYQVLYKGNVTVSGVETENSCSYDVDTTYYFQAASLATLPASDPTLAINYDRGGVSRDPETGTYTYWIAKKTRLYQKVAEYTSKIDASETVLSTHHKGVKAGDLNDSGADIGLHSLASATDGEVREQHRFKNADCSQDINEDRRQIADQTATGGGASDRKLVRADETITEEHHTAAAAAVADPVPLTGEMIDVVNKPTPYKGKTETLKQTRAIIDQQFDRAAVNAAETITETRHTAAAAGVTNPPVPAAGEMKEIQNKPTPYKDKTETIEQTKTIIDQTATGGGASDRKVVRADETITEERHTAAAAPVADPVPSAGEMVEVINKPLPYKDKTETVKQTRAITDQQFDRSVVSAAETITETRHTAAAAGVTNPPVPAAGEIKEIQNRPTPYKDKTETIQQTRAIIDQTATDATKNDLYEDNALVTIFEERHSAKSAAEAKVAVTDGVVVTVESEPLPFKDRFRTRKRTEQAKYLSGSYNYADRYGTTYVWWGINATAAQLTAAITTAALDATTNNYVSPPNFNKFNLTNYTIIKQPYGAGSGATGETTSTGSRTETTFVHIWDETAGRVMLKKGTVTIAWALAWYASYGAALTAISGGNENSRVIPSKGLFGAYKTTVTQPSSWSDAE